MALNWQWKDMMGTITTKDGYTYNLYEGNALMIALWENETQYNLQWFACDEEHFKNQLGLSKGYDDNFFCNFESIKLDTKYKSVPKIINLIAKAKKPFKIELY